jgi:cobalt-zinc-cadmium efflux system membrane fusion protein
LNGTFPATTKTANQGTQLKNLECKSYIARVLIAGLFGLVLSAENSHGQDIKMSADQIKAAGIQTSKPEAMGVAGEELKLNGYFSHSRLGTVAVSSLEAATVSEVLKENLSSVKAGEPLLRLMSEAWFRYQQEHVQNRTALSLAAQNAKRDKALFEDGLIPQRRMIDSQGQLTMAQASFQSTRQRLKLMGAGESQIRQLEATGNLSPTLTLLAPTAGNVSGLDLMAGKHVEAGKLLFQIVKPGALELVLTASPSQSQSIQAGLLVKLKDCNGQISALGRVLGVGGQLTEGSQTIPIRVSLSGQTSSAAKQSLACFKVNQFTEAFVQTSSSEKQGTAELNSQFKVPSASVVRVGKQAYVFAKKASGFEAIAVEAQILNTVSSAVKPVPRTGSTQQQTLSSSSELAVSGTVLLKGAMQGLGAE